MASNTTRTLAEEMNERSRTLFRRIVESYLEYGDPVGSRTLSQISGLDLSPASIRNVMSDLEQMGLIEAPHASAGRLPTQLGLRLFVDGLLEVGDLTKNERLEIDSQLAVTSRDFEDVLTQATSMLSGLSHCAGLVVADTDDKVLKHVEFVAIGPQRALVVMVSENGAIENRAIETPVGMPPSALTEATNYMNARLRDATLEQAQDQIRKEIERDKAELDGLTAAVIEEGLAVWSGDDPEAGSATNHRMNQQLIVRGQANLLEDINVAEDIERIQKLFEDLETKEDLIHLMELARGGEGVRIFIGSENKLFSLSGSSVVVSPYMNKEEKILGVIGVIGPTRLNYGRVIPMVDYTAKVIGRMLK